MKYAFKEPMLARYIYINPETNHVHLMMPISGGIYIGTDNTCKMVSSLQVFLGKKTDKQQNNALNELMNYKEALEHDIALVPKDVEISIEKTNRLQQINQYISALSSVQANKILDHLVTRSPVYPKSLQDIMTPRSNLYSMVLRPNKIDQLLTTVNPVFSVNRGRNAVFFQSLQEGYRKFKIPPAKDEKARLTTAVLNSLEDNQVDFEKIQTALSNVVKTQFNMDVDFTKNIHNHLVTKDFIDTQMGLDDTATAEEYVNSLIGFCSPNLFDTVLDSPFNKIKKNDKETLSILTQFLLAEINIHCFSQDMGSANFGRVLDDSAALGSAMVTTIINALKTEASVERAVCGFINTHSSSFELNRLLTRKDVKEIKQTFITHYATVEDSEHFDEFMILDTNKAGKFVSHQGAICTDFSEFIGAGFASLDNEFFERTRRDFANIQGILSSDNEWVNNPGKINDKKESVAEIPTDVQTTNNEKLLRDNQTLSTVSTHGNDIKSRLIKQKREHAESNKENIREVKPYPGR